MAAVWVIPESDSCRSAPIYLLLVLHDKLTHTNHKALYWSTCKL